MTNFISSNDAVNDLNARILKQAILFPKSTDQHRSTLSFLQVSNDFEQAWLTRQYGNSVLNGESAIRMGKKVK